MDEVRKLGLAVEERWRAKNFDELLFPDIARTALEEFALTASIQYIDILKWLNTTQELPKQQNIEATFGQPPVTLFASQRFYVEALFWLDGTTAIHSHAFAGAFQVLHGSSIHHEWGFEPRERINARMFIGDVYPKGAALLRKGDVHTIMPGSRFIHSVFHLDHPSVTLVVRTYPLEEAKPQLTYQCPHLAIDRLDIEEATRRRLQGLRTLWEMRHPAYDIHLAELVERSDLFTTLWILEQDLATRGDIGKCVPLFMAAREKHGRPVDFLIPLAEVRMRQEQIMRKRALVTDAEQRFFLAVLLNAPNKASALDLLRMKYPDKDPVDVIVDFVRGFATSGPGGGALLDVPGDEASLTVLRLQLQGKSPAETAKGVEAGHPAGPLTAGKVASLCDELRASLLKPLFIDAGPDLR